MASSKDNNTLFITASYSNWCTFKNKKCLHHTVVEYAKFEVQKLCITLFYTDCLIRLSTDHCIQLTVIYHCKLF